VDGTGSGLCHVAGFGITGVEPRGSIFKDALGIVQTDIVPLRKD
jgi:hypothetical protein